ncbi:Dynamin GTPase effector [Arabidopsis suecica]|uniref:Dynamin GTPase effector n=1 Tax=Arabidopsis suecica TaxID=45249 RepID=A0A8T1XW90_ARASU|nr:Dynamin GTPase effector [Arabidopsis suecica]
MMRILSYWTIVLQRIDDNLALHLQFIVRNLVDKEFQKEIVAEMADSRSGNGGSVHMLLEESPSVANKREKLNNNIKLLKESKDVGAAMVSVTIQGSRELEDQGDSDSGSLRTINLLWDDIEEMIGKEFDGRSFTVNDCLPLFYD